MDMECVASLAERLRPIHLMAVSVLGFILMLAGFLAYVLDPKDPYMAVFVVGVILLAAGYAILYLTGREESERLEIEEAREDEEGFFYVIDEDYSAYIGDTTVEDITGRM